MTAAVAESPVVQTVRYEPRGAARTLFHNRDAEVAMVGSAGTGKSMACLFRLHFAAMANPGIRGLIMRKTAVSLGATTLVTFEEKVAKEAIAAGVLRWYGGSTREAASYRYHNGSTIVVGGMDKPEKVLSSEYDLVFCDEGIEFTETDWETLATRLRHGRLSWQQQILATNPGPPTHWIKKRADRGALTLLTSRHVDNPAYVNADGTPTPQGREYLGRLDALTGVRRLRLRDGIWAAAEGIIYEGFDPGVHVIPKGTVIPKAWPRYWAVDFGYTNPFVCQCWAEDPDGRLWLEWEVYRTQRLVEDHAVTILDQVSRLDPKSVHHDQHPRRAHEGRIWTGPRPRAVICDHDAEDRATLERHLGLATVPAKKTVSDGIQYVQVRLKPAGDDKPRLFLRAGALVERDQALDDAGKPCCTAEEFPGYVWAVKPGNSGDLKEEPAKVNDHGMDATRYMVAHRDAKVRGSIRWL
ncbi:phage terminase large subunit [Phytohabitans sp. ZYX-F-186]|uniref:Phage terminase large subunit n=1 Tax=Phytohabitans maris TaxID=3071409 RepID=A0ABU0ZUR8_9ACTN|nr:phage terminase large subunit [Phytohabitans sp. ZYX-F-186]MDQ7910247.1 phage terminase large subunit [Phytohabitans sp. ZYX-F-186]